MAFFESARLIGPHVPPFLRGARSIASYLALVCALAVSAADGPARGNVTDVRVLDEAGTGTNWFLKGGDFSGQHYSPLDEINEGNVENLGLAWSRELPIPDGIATTPIVVDGVIYISGASSLTYAVDAATGEVLWHFDPNVRAAFAEHSFLSWVARASRGLAVWDGSVFVATADCRLIALDAARGKELWSRQTCDNDLGFFITDSPYVGGGKVFLGNGGSESEEKGRGYISAYDARTGDLAWRFYIVPSDNPEENDTPAMKMAAETWSGDALAKYGGGGHSWNEMTYDPASKLLFFGTSGAYPYSHAERSPAGGSNLFLSSVVAVDAETGEYRWHYQTVDRDSWDYNATMNIVLADMSIHDLERQTLMIAPKNGFHYTLDRHTGELLAVGPFARTTWASGIDTETGAPVYDPAGEVWNLGEDETAYLWPNSWGAHSWQPMAYHPQTNLSYIPVVDAPAEVSGSGEQEAIVMLTEVDGEPHAPGKTVAIDPATGMERFRIDHELPFNGGLMTTAGNLLFQGLGTGHFEAYTADAGEKLWSVQTGSAINAAPASYALDGTQYVVIPVGAGGGLQYMYPEMHGSAEHRGPTRLMAFTLEGRATIGAGSIDRPALPDQPKRDASIETLAYGEALYGGYCKICHGSNVNARAGGSVPDLRYVTTETVESWDAIVVGGLKAPGGMPAMEISVDDSQKILSYVLSRADALREERASTRSD